MRTPPAPPRLLVVEDDPSIRDLLALLLHDEGYEPLFAASLAEAHALLATRAVDLILTDLFNHAGADPLAAIRALHARAGERPVGVMTGWALTPAEVAGAGGAFLVRKPFDLDQLLLAIAASLAAPLSPVQERQAAVVRRYFAALSARDWDALLALCSDAITYVLPAPAPFAATVQGRAAFRAYTEETYRHFPATRFADVQVYATPHGLAARYEATWRTPDGVEAQQEGVVLFAFGDGQITRIGVSLDAERLRALLAGPAASPPAMR